MKLDKCERIISNQRKNIDTMKSILLCTLILAFSLGSSFDASAQTIKITRGKSTSTSYRLAGLDNEEKANLQVNEQEPEEEKYDNDRKGDCNCDGKEPKCETKCIPAGTQIDLELDDHLDLETLTEKKVVRFRVATAVQVGKTTVIPTSAYALGVVKKFVPGVDARPAMIILEAQTLHTGTGQLPINLKGAQQIIKTIEPLYTSPESIRASIEHEVRVCIPCCR